MAFDITVVDAFTDRRFSGNPAAICFVEEFPSDGEMQDVAREMNLAETAFVVARGEGTYDLRWFTPLVEVDLCGHATLATASLIEGTSTFATRSGALHCRNRGDGWIEMDFPADPPTALDRPVALPFFATWVGKGRTFLLAEVESASELRRYIPDFGAIAALGDPLIVTTTGDRDGIDCVSRFFAPNFGIPEDPVTGSAHCVLAPYWGEKLGRTALSGEQASARGGFVEMELLGGDRVLLRGQSVTVSTVHFA